MESLKLHTWLETCAYTPMKNNEPDFQCRQLRTDALEQTKSTLQKYIKYTLIQQFLGGSNFMKGVGKCSSFRI